jgi:eukaryotic-like serine/threonine-protein kinase
VGYTLLGPGIMQSAAVQIGTIVAGKYRIERVIGEGGMGIIVAATHLILEQQVAIKFLHSDAIGNPEAIARLAREARAVVKLKSEHVARTFDVGTLDNGSPYIVMELLVGADLAGLIRQGPLTVQAASLYVLQALEAIAEAHAASIVHRDLKPGNLFLTSNADGSPCIKVLDFGIAKAAPGPGGTELSLTRTTTVMGSPGYMSPEQLRSSRDVDARADIWSLGVILFELVSGRPPFSGASFSELCLKIGMDATPALTVRGGGMPRGFEAVVRRCLEKEPDRRYPDAGELAAALAPFAGPEGEAAAARVARVLVARGGAARTGGQLKPATTGPRPAAPVPAAPAPRRRSRGVIIGAAVGAVGAVGVVIALAAGGGGGGRTAAPAISAPASADAAPPPTTSPDAAPARPADAAPAPDAPPVVVEIVPPDAAPLATPVDAGVRRSRGDGGPRRARPDAARNVYDTW